MTKPFRVKYSLSGWLCGRRRGLHSGFISHFILTLLSKQEVIAVIMVGLRVFISPSAKSQQNKAVRESLQRNMPRIIISLTHLFVSLGISEGRKGIFYCDRDSSLNEGLPSNNLGYPAAFCSSARVREGGGILRWSDASFRKHRRPAYSLIIPLYHMLQR